MDLLLSAVERYSYREIIKRRRTVADSYCGQKDAAVRLLRSAIEQNYCAYTALQTDPLLAKLRGTPEFSELLSAAKDCQNKFLAGRDKDAHIKDANPEIFILKQAKTEYAKQQ